MKSHVEYVHNTDKYYTNGKKGFDSFKINAIVLNPGDKFTLTISKN